MSDDTITCTCPTRVISGEPIRVSDFGCPTHGLSKVHTLRLGSDEVEVVYGTLTRQGHQTMAEFVLRDRTSGAYLTVTASPVVWLDRAPEDDGGVVG